MRNETESPIGAAPSTDEILLERINSDDQLAFGRLFDRYAARVHGHCARQLGTADEADDLTGIVFLEAWRHRRRIRIVEGTALPWLLMTATNVARNHRRGRVPIMPTMSQLKRRRRRRVPS